MNMNMKMPKLYQRMPGPGGIAIQHLFASSIAGVLFADPTHAASGTEIRHSGRDAVIYLPVLRLAITSVPIGEMARSMQRYQAADFLGIDLLIVDLGREAGRVEVALDYGSPTHRGREPAPCSVLWLGIGGIYLIPLDRSGTTPAIRLTATGFADCPIPFATEAEWVDGLEAASFAAERARAAQRLADASADIPAAIG